MVGFVEVFFLGLTLALDASIVAFSYGLCKPWRVLSAFKLATVSSFFQWMMPILGWYMMYLAQDGLKEYADTLDHWITFIIFGCLGIKIIRDSFDEEKEESCMPLSFSILLMVGIGTSIDALAAGVMIFTQALPLWQNVFLIGVITFVLVFAAYCASLTCSKLPTRYLEVIAGLVLILLGFKVLIEHIYG